MSRLLRLSSSAALAAIVCVALPPSAAARPAFQGAVQQALDLAALPDCPLCHVGSQSRDTATTDFIVALRNNGLDFNKAVGLITEEDISNAAAAADAAGDPAIAAARGSASAEYGCFESGGSVAGSSAPSPRLASMVVAGLLAGFLFFRRRRLGGAGV